MNADTPYFRAVLTFSLIWIAVSGYLFYSDYREKYHSLRNAQYHVPEWLTDECFSLVPDWSAENYSLRKPTSEETESCLTRARDFHERLITSDYQLVLKQAWSSFAFKGVLPSLALIGIAAFWTAIASGMARAVSGYLSWLRFGSRKPIDQNEDDEA